MFYKNPLIITDNLYLFKKLQKIIFAYNFTFSISPFSNIIDFKKVTKNVNVFNLKNNDDIKHIINSYDLVISLHCKQLFPRILVNSVKCINLHPGYNPMNRGWYPQVFSIINNLEIGATIHEIDEKLDHGAIIDRIFVKSDFTDTSLTLYRKVIHKELYLFKKHIKLILNNNYKTFIPECEGNLFLKKDFEELKEIKLNEKETALNFINKLRALTHGKFKNAYFINPDNGKKVFLSINLNYEK